jgi:excisionase family DNA binding protein
MPPERMLKKKFTPPEVAARYGVGRDKVLGWIKSGELRAINAAAKPGGRPRYLIDQEDLVLFEQRRAVGIPPAPTRPMRRGMSVIEFF